MSDVSRISLLGIIFLVILRIAIGWQLLYEGLWKLNTLQTSYPWTAEPYLKNAQGPFRDYFRSLTGDPDDLNWLDYDFMTKKWDKLQTNFIQFYNLDEKRAGWVKYVLNGPESFVEKLDALPEGLVLPEGYSSVLKYDAEKKQLVCSGKYHMTPTERQMFLDLAIKLDQNDQAVKNYISAVNSVYNQAKSLSFKERLLVIIKGDPETAGITWTKTNNEGQEETIAKKIGEIELYRKLLPRYEEKLEQAKIDYHFDHLDYEKADLQSRKNTVIAPVKKLEQDMLVRFQSFLETDQLRKGALPTELNLLKLVDLSTMWGLTILGALLIAGMFTRVAALGAAVLVLQFYLAYPPIPGYPEVAGPEHSIIVNKNLIEVLVLLAFVCLPSGMWFGVDSIFARMFAGKKRKLAAKTA